MIKRGDPSWTKEMGCQSSTPRVHGFQTCRSFMTSAINSHTPPSGVTMLWQKPSVRVLPRLRGSSFYSEWEIIERDNVLVVLCCHRYCKEERKEKQSNNVLAKLCSHWYYKEEKKGKKRYWYNSMGRGVGSSGCDDCVFKKNLDASKPSEHPPQVEECLKV